MTKPGNPFLPEPGQDRVYLPQSSILGNLLGLGSLLPLGGLGGAMPGLLAGLAQQQQDAQALQQRSSQLQMDLQAWAMMNQRQAAAPPPPLGGKDLARIAQLVEGQRVEEAIRILLEIPGAQHQVQLSVDQGRVVGIRTAEQRIRTGPGATLESRRRWDQRPVSQADLDLPATREQREMAEIMAELDEIAPNGVIEPPEPELRWKWWERVIIWLARLVHYVPG